MTAESAAVAPWTDDTRVGRPEARDLAWVTSAAPFALYLLTSVLATASVWSDPMHRLIGPTPDSKLFVWFLRWTPWAIVHGHNPLFTTHVMYPTGANLMWNTAAPLLAVVLWPVTATVGPIAAYNLAVVAAFTLSSSTAYLAFRRFTLRRWPAAVGGGLYGFSPFMIGHALGHIHLVFAFAPPLVLMIVHRHLSEPRRSVWRSGALLGLLIAVQALMGEEMLALTAIGAVLWLGFLALGNRDRVVAYLPGLLRLSGVAALVSGVLLAAPLGFQFFGPQRITGQLFDPRTYSIDLLAFVTPTHRQLLAPTWHSDPFDVLSGGGSEAGAFLLPLLLVSAAALLVTSRSLRRLVAIPAAATAVTALILSMGPRLHVDGHVLPMPLPAGLFSALPVSENILPTRFLVVATFALALLTSLTLDTIAAGHRQDQRRVRLAIVALALVAMTPRPVPSYTPHVPEFFRAGAPGISSGSTVLFWPNNTPPALADAMLDQATAGMRFRMTDGYILAPLRAGQNHYLRVTVTPLNLLLTSTVALTHPDPVKVKSARRYLLSTHASAVVVPIGQLSVEARDDISAVTETSPVCAGGVCLWGVNDAR